MRTIDTVATVAADGTLRVKLPPDIAPGQHRVVVVIDEASTDLAQRASLPRLTIHVSAWGSLADETFRREDMDGDDGR